MSMSKNMSIFNDTMVVSWLVLVACVAVVAAKTIQTKEDNVNEATSRVFEEYLQSYNKSYSEIEMNKRVGIFSDRLKQIEKSIQDYKEGRSLHELGVNKFTDRVSRNRDRLS